MGFSQCLQCFQCRNQRVSASSSYAVQARVEELAAQVAALGCEVQDLRTALQRPCSTSQHLNAEQVAVAKAEQENSQLRYSTMSIINSSRTKLTPRCSKHALIIECETPHAAS